MLYDEADNTFHFEGTASRDIFEVLTLAPDRQKPNFRDSSQDSGELGDRSEDMY